MHCAQECKWCTIPGFSKYDASTTGLVRRKDTQYMISLNSKRNGYIRISIVNEENQQKSVTVHQLVALTFIANPENKATVNHIDHNRENNHIDNLEWATVTEQNRHKRKVPRSKQRLMSSRKVWRINAKTDEREELFETIRDAAKWVFDSQLTKVKEFNEGNNIKTKICAVCQNRVERNGYVRTVSYGYKWQYDDSDIHKYTNELWRDIPPHLIHHTEGYKISSKGRIQNHHGKISVPYSQEEQYAWVSVYPKQYQVHRLVAQTFLPNYYGKSIVNHKNGIKNDPSLFNLEWVTLSENAQHAHNTGLHTFARPVTRDP